MALHEGESHSLANGGFIIHFALASKYSDVFAFPLAKPIAQLVFNEPHSPINILFRDLTTLADDAEMLHRLYRYRNPRGEEEIEDRIRRIGKGLLTDHAFTVWPEYPLMMVTNTSRIFQARLRRLRKMKSCDGSSDDSEEPKQDIEAQYSSQGFLESIPSSQQSSSIEDILDSAGDLSFGESVHDIYDKGPLMQEITQINIKGCGLEQHVHHLVYDFGDMDVQATISNYYRIVGRRAQDRYHGHEYMDMGEGANHHSQTKRQGANRRYNNYITGRDQFESNYAYPAYELRAGQNQIWTEGGAIERGRVSDMVGALQHDRKKKVRDKALALLGRVRGQHEAK